MLQVLQSLVIQTGHHGKRGPWAVIDCPDPDRSDYLLVDGQGCFLFAGPEAPLKDGKWARQPLRPRQISLGETVCCLAAWFKDSPGPIIGMPAQEHHPAAVSIQGPDGSMLELSDEPPAGRAWLSGTGGVPLAAGDIARTLHIWFGR